MEEREKLKRENTALKKNGSRIGSHSDCKQTRVRSLKSRC